MRTLRIALALLMLAPLSLNAQAINVAVFPLSGFAVGQDGNALAGVLRDMLITELSENQKLKMVERNSIDQLMKSRALSLSGKAKDEEAWQVGQLLGAQYGIAGGLTMDGKTARLDLRLVDVETGVVENTFKESIAKDEFLSLVEKIALKFGDLKVKARVADVVVPVPSQFAYSRGLDYEKRGDKKKAAEMFEAALKIFPDNAQAKAALDRVK